MQINAATAANLDLYDPATGIGELTDLYLNDRAKMLAWKMQYDSGTLDSDDALFPFTPGKAKPYSEAWDSWKVPGDWDFIDRSLLVGGLPFTLAIDGLDPLKVTENHKIVFGSANPETLIGDILVDHLYGGAGAGADTLTGNKGNDYLEGGSGFDSYIFNAGDGYDTVLDIDGSGVIKFGTLEAKGSVGVLATKWKQFSSNVWQDQQNGISYVLSP